MKTMTLRRWSRTTLVIASMLYVGANDQTPLFAQISSGTLQSAESDSAELNQVRQHLAAGEFAAARRLSQSFDADKRDLALALIANQLANSGQTTAAIRDLQAIDAPAVARSTAAALMYRNSGSGFPSGYASSDSRGGLSNGSPATPGGMGGGSLADFGSLMSLIQTTIAPDQWEALGGPSTMFPYPNGIYVDPSGLVRDIEVPPADRVTSLKSLATRVLGVAESTNNKDWTAPANLRAVSLKRLRQAHLRLAASGQPVPLEMQNLAGLSEIRYVIIEADDVLLAGTVGGIDPGAMPWPQDLASHKTALGFDLLVASAHSVLHQAAYGCTIDPTAAGMKAAAEVSIDISNKKIAPALAADALAKAMGEQDIILFDVPPDQPLAWLLVDADRHMKQLALGQHPMPHGLFNYLDVVEQAAKQSSQQAVPGGQLLRMWFSSNPKQIQQASDSLTFELSGLPIKLLTAKEFTDQNGGRVQAGADPLGEVFAKGFNHHFHAIAAKYPVYDRLRGAFELTAALQLVKTQVGNETFAQLLGELCHPDLLLDQTVSVPNRCDSLAVRHSIRTPKKRHEVYIVSGGIKVDPAQSLVSKVTNYPPLDGLNLRSHDGPVQNTRWWWDR